MSIRHLSTAAALALVTAGCRSPSSSPTAPSAVADRPATVLAIAGVLFVLGFSVAAFVVSLGGRPMFGRMALEE